MKPDAFQNFFTPAFCVIHRSCTSWAFGRGGLSWRLNMGLIKGTKVSLPPLDLQRAFAGRVAAIDKIKVDHRAHLAKLDALFGSLQHRAFRGQL